MDDPQNHEIEIQLLHYCKLKTPNHFDFVSPRNKDLENHMTKKCVPV